MSEPVFTKREPRRYDYKPMTWGMFLNLMQWAEAVANDMGHPVYLVGSVLCKEIPRDIDVSVIMPLDDYEKAYGKLPEKQEEYPKYLMDVHNKTANIAKYFFDGREALGEEVEFDFKICADTWFKDKPKLLLAQPRERLEGDEKMNSAYILAAYCFSCAVILAWMAWKYRNKDGDG